MDEDSGYLPSNSVFYDVKNRKEVKSDMAKGLKELKEHHERESKVMTFTFRGPEKSKSNNNNNTNSHSKNEKKPFLRKGSRIEPSALHRFKKLSENQNYSVNEVDQEVIESKSLNKNKAYTKSGSLVSSSVINKSSSNRLKKDVAVEIFSPEKKLLVSNRVDTSIKHRQNQSFVDINQNTDIEFSKELDTLTSLGLVGFVPELKRRQDANLQLLDEFASIEQSLLKIHSQEKDSKEDLVSPSKSVRPRQDHSSLFQSKSIRLPINNKISCDSYDVPEDNGSIDEENGINIPSDTFRNERNIQYREIEFNDHMNLFELAEFDSQNDNIDANAAADDDDDDYERDNKENRKDDQDGQLISPFQIKNSNNGKLIQTQPKPYKSAYRPIVQEDDISHNITILNPSHDTSQTDQQRSFIASALAYVDQRRPINLGATLRQKHDTINQPSWGTVTRPSLPVNTTSTNAIEVGSMNQRISNGTGTVDVKGPSNYIDQFDQKLSLQHQQKVVTEPDNIDILFNSSDDNKATYVDGTPDFRRPVHSTRGTVYLRPKIADIIEQKPPQNRLRSTSRGKINPSISEDELKQREEKLKEQAKQLDAELEIYNKENTHLRQLKKQHEAALTEIAKEKLEVNRWAHEERIKTEAWVQEQRSQIQRERRTAAKIAQEYRNRANGEGVWSSRRERAEAEVLQATIEKLRADLDLNAKKTRTNEKRLQTIIADATHRINCLEESLQSLEKEKLILWQFIDESGLNLPAGLARLRPAALQERTREERMMKIKKLDTYAEPVDVEYLPIISTVLQSTANAGTEEDDQWGIRPPAHSGNDTKDRSSDIIKDQNKLFISPVVTKERSINPTSVMIPSSNTTLNVFSGATDKPASDPGGRAGRAEEILPAGGRRITYKNGTVKEVYANGSALVLFTNGDTKFTCAESGDVVYYYKQARTRHTTRTDGLEVYEFPNGQIERHYPDGHKEISLPGMPDRVIYPDGTQKELSSVTM